MKLAPSKYKDIAFLPIESVLEKFNTSWAGLSPEAALQAQQTYGKNILPVGKQHWWKILFDQFNSPFIYLLFVICGLMFLLGDTTNALIILVIIAINTIFGFYQEYKAGQAVHTLKMLLIPKTTVIRHGKEIEIPSEDLVPGDIIALYPGDIIPADARLIRADHLFIDESSLTGESIPVAKVATIQKNEPETSTLGLSGTVITSGKGLGVVLSIGKRSALGEIAELVTQEVPPSHFSRGISQISKYMIYVTIITIVMVIVVHLIIARGHLSLFELLVFAAALGVSVIPETLPIVITFCLTRGALKLAEHEVVVKRLSAIEDLGSIQVLCTDKTGTLTENTLKVVDYYGTNTDQLLIYAILGSGAPRPNVAIIKGFDTALWTALGKNKNTHFDGYEKKDEIPFDPARRRSTILYKKDHEHELVIRGAPESILSVCALSAEKQQHILSWMNEQGILGFRVIGVAHKIISHDIQNESDLKEFEHNMEFLGLIAFEDPLKQTAIDAVERAKELGVKLKIISGDTPQVCAAVGLKVGIIDNVDQIISGSQFEQLSYEEKQKAALECNVFARILPKQKYELISLLKEQYQVAYMGDGINDAPALKIADVALAVDQASDVAREAADIILLKKSLRVIIDGIYQGRMTFINTIKFLKITLAGNLGNFYAIAIASLLIDYLPMLPTQLLLLNLLSDMPLIAISTDTVDEQEMQLPQKYNFKDIALITLLLGMVSTFFDFIIFGLFYRMNPAVLQTNWFIASLLTEIAFIFSVRSSLPCYKAHTPSLPLIGLSLLTGGIAVMLPYTAIGQEYFHFIAPQVNHIMIIVGVVIIYFITTELVKSFYYYLMKK